MKLANNDAEDIMWIGGSARAQWSSHCGVSHSLHSFYILKPGSGYAGQTFVSLILEQAEKFATMGTVVICGYFNT
jgi:hypothetical protein